MKPVQEHNSAHTDCSCLSCFYKSESDKPSLRRFVRHGSRIDKLYYGKYLPLREKKLLERLVRTRAVYDDLQKQILSDSTVSYSRSALKTRAKKLPRVGEFDRIKRSRDISLVNLINKGEDFSSENLSECCSCCICGSNISTDETRKRRLHIHKYKPMYEWRHAYNREYSKANRQSNVKDTPKHKLGQISEFHKNVRFRTKRVQSEPCTCTYKFSGLMKRASSSIKKMLDQENSTPELKPLSTSEQYKPNMLNTENVIKQSFQKVKRSHACLCNNIEGSTKIPITNVEKYPTKMATELKSTAKRSVEGLNHIKYEVKKKYEYPQRKTESLIPEHAEKIDRNTFRIKKDSLTKFREQLRRRRERQGWRCDFQCYPDECNPEQCFRIKRRKKNYNILEKRLHETTRVGKKVGESSLNSDISIQVDKIENATKAVKKKQKSNNIQANKAMEKITSGVKVDTKEKINTNTKKLKPGINQTKYTIPVSKIKSTTNVSQAKFETPSEFSGNISSPVNPKRNKNKSIKLNKEEDSIRLNRQAVRVGSSFSFNIEFYKNKPLNPLPMVNVSKEILQKNKSKFPTKKKHKTINVKEKYDRKTRQHNKKLNTPYSHHNTKKNIQVSGHLLKRCFCTLQLKAKKTKLHLNRFYKPESVQTNNQYSARMISLPFKCKPNICVSDKCNPSVCKNKIRKRTIKHRYISTNTDFETKAVDASITSKSVSSSTPYNMQNHSTRTPESILLTTAPANVNVTKNYKHPKQAVRIGSTFSFNIDFSKEYLSGIDNNMNTGNFTTPVKTSFKQQKQNGGINKSRSYIHHEYPHTSNSTRRSRHTKTKQLNSLPRCSYTLKCGRPEKRKSIISMSKSTVKSSQSFDRASNLYPVLKTTGVGTNKKVKKMKLRFLPYECEPDICVLGKYDPHKCRKLLLTRQPKPTQSRARKLNTDIRKTRATSSLTSATHKLTKTKKVQSEFIAHERKLPNYVPRKTVTALQLVNKPQPNNDSNRQVVKIGSNFSFNIECYKEKLNGVASVVSPRLNRQVIPVINIHQTPKSVEPQILLKDHTLQKIQPKLKSIQMQVEKKGRRNIQIGTAMKHCFCTLSHYKKAKDTRNKVINTDRQTQTFTAKTQTHVSTVPQNTMANKNYKYLRYFDPFECEPYVCVPGKCNPYKCLEIIRKRDRIRSSKEMGVITKSINRRSRSSDIQNVIRPTKDALIQSNIEKQQNFTNKRKQGKLSPQSNLSERLRNMNTKKARQAVNISSNFRFDIEFYKSQPQKQFRITQKKLKERDEQDTNIKTYRNSGDHQFQISSSHRESQAVIKKTNKRSGVALIKKCFCTLKLWKKQQINKSGNLVKSQVNQSIKPHEVYTVGRITTDNNKYIPQHSSVLLTKNKKCTSQAILMNEHIENRISNMNKVFDFGFVQDTKIYSLNNLSSSSVINPKFIENKNSFMYDQDLKRVLNHDKGDQSSCLNYALREQLPKFGKSLNIVKDTDKSINDEICSNYSLKKVFNNITKLEHSVNLNHASPFIKKSFYAMNIEITGQKKPIMNKLEPYECEPDVCKPYKCDPLKCQELINKRLSTPVGITSGTETNFKSTSSSTSQTRSSAIKTRKLQTSKANEGIKRKRLSNLENKVMSENRQAVRVGSSFNISMEFSKSKSNGQKLKYTPDKYYAKLDKKLRCKKCQVEQPKTKQMQTQNYESESKYIKIDHKASNTTPFLKRCFCTLKFKKRKDKISIVSTESQTSGYSELEHNIINLKNLDSAQNTKSSKGYKNIHIIEPYECTPGVCIPYRCDPYQCLKLVEKRKQTKNYGVESMRSKNISTSSMTRRQRTKMYNKCIESKSSDSVIKPNKLRKLILNTHPVMQGVHIGSNFSFNVQFFKENSRTPINGKSKTPKLLTKYSPVKNTKDVQEHKKYSKSSKENFWQNKKFAVHKASQTDFGRHVKSTITNNFINRCFCVAKLRRGQNIQSGLPKKNMNAEEKAQSEKTSSFLKRCFCFIKSITTVKETSKNATNLQSAISPQTKANNRLINDIPHPQKLASYEREPSICTPGICDHYACPRIIKNRKTLSVTRKNKMEKYKTQSVSSSARTSMTVKDKRTQCNRQKIYKKHERRSSYTSGLKDKRHQKLSFDLTPDRQAVRIGSNFSFDVEFYKHKKIKSTDKQASILASNYNDKIRKIQNKGTYSQKTILNNQETQATIKKKNRTSDVSHLLRRCFCTLALQKKQVRKIRSEISTTNNKASSYVKRIPYDRNKNMLTLGTTEIKPNKRDPYLCKADICNQRKCDKRTRRQLQREFNTLTDAYETKSASSFTAKPLKKENIKVKSKLENKENVFSKDDKQFKVKIHKKLLNKQNNKSCKQAVNISSNFGFDIKFLKDKFHEDEVKVSKSPKKTHKSSKQNIFSVAPQSISHKHKKSQDIKSMRNIDSQVLDKNDQSTITRDRPFLKRCFCTLKLQKNKKKSPPITMNTVETVSDVKETFNLSPKLAVSNKTTCISNRETEYVPFMNLKTYECEPGACIPGKCNPYECFKKINIREKRRASITQKTKKLNKYCSAESRAKSIKSQTISSEERSRKSPIQNITSPIVSLPSIHRQAVRVASSFSFNVELFKDRKLPKFYKVPKNRKLYVKNEKCSECVNESKNGKYICGNEGLDFRHRQSQLNRSKTKSKGSVMEPLLKRCFCTLKLQKLGKNSKLQPNIVKDSYTETDVIAQNRDYNKIENLKPYECVPGFCTPGYCNPYDCETRIKKRLIRELGTVTECSNLKSTSSMTARKNKMKSTRSQKQKIKREEKANNINKLPKKMKSNVISSPTEAKNQQVVRVGSNFSFNIEFYKDRLLKHTRSSPLPQNVKNSKKFKNIDGTTKRSKNFKNRGSQGKSSSYNRGSATLLTYTESKGSGVQTKLKRCFCTLALQKFSGIPIPNSQFNTISKSRVNKAVEVTTQTKFHHNKIKRYSLKPYECEPGICIPRQCNPYDCIKIIQRNTRRRFRTTGTQQRIPSRISVSTLTYPSLPKSKTVQSNGKFRNKHTLKTKNNGKVLVQEPYFSLASHLKNIPTVKIGSNISFDIEFFKKSTPRKVYIDSTNELSAKHKSTKMRPNSKDAKCTNSTCKVINSRGYKSRSEISNTENKASFAGNILKRCFCTAKLFNTPSILNNNVVSKNGVKYPQGGYGFNPQQYYVYYQLKKSVKNVCPKRCMCTLYNKDFPTFSNTVGTTTKKKYLKFNQNEYSQSKSRSCTSDQKKKDLREMVTILPYTPSKFNKKSSKTVLTMVNGTKKSSSRKCHPICSDNNNLYHNYFKKFILNGIKSPEVSKKLNNKQTNTSLLKNRFTILPISSPLKVVVSRGKEKFAKHKYMIQGTDFSHNDDNLKIMSQKSKELKSPFKLDYLKISKSERHPVEKNRNEPKISKSLKMLKFSHENELKSVSPQRNKKYSRFQHGDVNQNTPATIKLHKTGDSNEYKKYISTHYQLKYDNKLAEGKILKSSKQSRKKVKFSGVSSKGENKVRQITSLNSLMKKILCKCRATQNKENKQPTKIRKDYSSPRKSYRNLLGCQEYYDIAHYSSETGRWNDTKNKSFIKIVNLKDDEITDTKKDNLKSETRELIEDIKKGKEITFPLVITGRSQIRDERKSFENKQTKNKAKGTAKQYSRSKLQDGKQIKGQYYNDSKIKHNLTRNLKSGAKLVLSAKATNKKKSCECLVSMNKDKEAKILAKKMKGKICKCYPSVCECAKVVKAQKEKNKKRKAFFKRQSKRVKMEKKRHRRLEKEKKAAKKRSRREFLLRQKRYKIEDALRLHKRKDLNKYLEHRLRLKGTPDYLVATESLLDLAKLSCTVMEDIARSTYRAMIDPCHTRKRVEATIKKPSSIWPILKTAVVNSGAPATFKRIILRCKTMSSVKKIRAKLEQNRCTNYLLHIADRDPRKRLKMKKAQQRLKRQRVPLDFQCSLYMASLRKKPYLKVYFKCPWFYPHFLNLLNVLRQLADMFLFILAAIVWSPCILGMELCRAMMCCLLCTR